MLIMALNRFLILRTHCSRSLTLTIRCLKRLLQKSIRFYDLENHPCLRLEIQRITAKGQIGKAIKEYHLRTDSPTQQERNESPAQ